MEAIEKGIRAASQNWQDSSLANGDVNTIDVLWCAENLYPEIGDSINTDSMSYEARQALINLVENLFVTGEITIRFLPNGELIRRAKDLAKKIKEDKLLDFKPVESVAISLYLWHGCICMAKTTRVKDSQGTQYNLVMRNRDYIKLRNEWESAERIQNPWIRRGVNVAKSLSESRGDSIVNEWIPEDSPYWE